MSLDTTGIKPFNRLELVSSDVEFFQNVRDESVANRIIDALLSPGIVPPLGATASDMQDGLTNVTNVPFVITADAGDIVTPTIKVGPTTLGADVHIAYDKLGNRIRIPLADDHFAAPIWNHLAPALTTTGVTGNTPYSTGRTQVHVPKPGSGSTDYYIFVSYVPVVRTISITDNPAFPPNHQTIDGATTITPSNDGNKPVEGIDELLGVAYAHHIVDGYRIFAGTTAGGQVTNAGTGSIPTLAANVFTGLGIAGPNEPDSSNAIFIGKVNVTSGGIITITQNDNSGTGNKRPILKLKPEAGALISTKTPAYASGQTVTLLEHINAVSTGTVSPNNPHGTTATDVGVVPGGVLGILNKQTVVPINGNPNFATYVTPTAFTLLWNTVTLSGGGTSALALTSAAGADLTNIQTTDGGPEQSSGGKLAFTVDGGVGVNVALSTSVNPVKSSSSYTLTGWFQFQSPNNPLNLSAYITDFTGTTIVAPEQDFTPTNPASPTTWQRFAIPLVTNSSSTITDPTSGHNFNNQLFIRFHHAAPLTASALNILITNVMLVEGTFTLGDVAKKSLPITVVMPGAGFTGNQTINYSPVAGVVFQSSGQNASIIFSVTSSLQDFGLNLDSSYSILMTIDGVAARRNSVAIERLNSGVADGTFFHTTPHTLHWGGYLSPGSHTVILTFSSHSSNNPPVSPNFVMGTGILDIQLL